MKFIATEPEKTPQQTHTELDEETPAGQHVTKPTHTHIHATTEQTTESTHVKHHVEHYSEKDLGLSINSIGGSKY
jgi:hypothetical protein